MKRSQGCLPGFGLNEYTVSTHLKRRRIERRVNGTKLSPEDIEKAAELHPSDLSWAAIAEQFDVNPQTIGRGSNEPGVPMRPRQGGLPAQAPRASRESKDSG